jgi:hypothetical protein
MLVCALAYALLQLTTAQTKPESSTINTITTTTDLIPYLLLTVDFLTFDVTIDLYRL